MELVILGYIAGLMTYIYFEVKKSKMESILNNSALTQSVKNIEKQIGNIIYIRIDIEDLNKRFKDRGF